MLRPCRINPKISAYTYLEGHHDYNRVPFVPMGWRALVYEDPERRASWAYHGVEGFAIAPAPDHYCCTTCWIPSTGVNKAERELGKALQQMATNNPLYSHLGTFAGLKQLTNIVRKATSNAQAQMVTKETVPVQRVSEERDAPRPTAQPQAIPFDDDEISQPQRVEDEDPNPDAKQTKHMHLARSPVQQAHPPKHSPLSNQMQGPEHLTSAEGYPATVQASHPTTCHVHPQSTPLLHQCHP
ncbi:hypothetical protein ACHAWF_012741 [Thalassiosira exigua]